MNGTTQAWLQHICWVRSHYTLPPRADSQARDIIDGSLALLFPHLAHERRCEPEAVINEIEALRFRLHSFLRDKGREESDAHRTSAQFIDRLPAIHDACALDAQATCDADPAATSLDEVILAYPGVYALACYRLAHELLHLGVTILPRLVTELAHRETGIDIHPAARLGHSIAIDHGTGIVIGETSTIGDRVRIYQGVTLGALSVKKALASTKRHPTIEDDVVIYANATILGGETVVGRGSIIGGNVWLTHSVPPRSVVTHTAPVEQQVDPDALHPLEYHL